LATKQATEWKDKGNAEFKAGNHAKAIEFYTYATELDPNNPVFFTNRSNAYYQIKDFEKSARDARKAISKDNGVKGYYRLGMALMGIEGSEKEAVDAFKTAVDLEPKNVTFVQALTKSKAHMMKGMSTAEILKGDGNDAFKAGRIEQAVEIYGKAIAACTKSEKDLDIKCDCLANRAACNRQLYLPEECIADATAALEIKPNHVKSLIRRGQAFESMEKYKQALEDFDKAARLDPKAVIAYQGASRLRASMNKYGSGKN
jgi:tetratricopeptide (TPR) repeat protein